MAYNNCGLFIAKSSSYIYFKYIGFVLVVFDGISIIAGYLMPNPVNIYIYIYIYKMCMIGEHILLVTFLIESLLILFTKLNGFTYFYLIRMILLIIITINHLFAHS